MQGIHQVIRTDQQRESFARTLVNRPLPFKVKLEDPTPPKTLQQIKYAHSLCNALSAHHAASPENGKKDAKAAFGVVVVSTSLVTGQRNARLKSFADYTKDEMSAFVSQMEAHLDEKLIPYTPSEKSHA